MARPIRIVGHGEKPADQFQAHPHNPRKHPQRQRAAVAESLSRLGWYDVVIENVRTGHLIDGHERIWQALDAGDVVPYIQVDLSEEEERLALASHDWLSSLAEWDKAMLDDLLHQIDDGGKLLEEMAADFRIEDLLPAKDEDPGPQIDRAEELREKWGTARGQVWQVGEHRVMCGDSTSADDVARLMDGQLVGAIVTDPPYGIKLDTDFSTMRNRLDFAQEKGVRSGRMYKAVIDDDKHFDAASVIEVWGSPDEQMWFGADYYSSTLPDTEHEGAWLVWDKRLDDTMDKMYGSCFELIWSKRKVKRSILRHRWAGIFGTEHEPHRGRAHPTQKPVAVLVDLLGHVKSERIADPYLGSGTTLVACQQTGRRGYGMEIDPAYVAVTLERLAGMGLDPQLLQVGQE